MSPATLLPDAIAASGLSARSFAAIIAVDERTVRRWIAGERDVPGPVRVICRAILDNPGIIDALRQAMLAGPEFP